MQFKILTIGKSRQKFVSEAEKEYAPRLSGIMKLTVEELEFPKLSKLPESERKTRETEELLKRVRPGDFLIILDEHGKTFDTVKLSGEIQKRMNEGYSSFVLAIGGAYGFDLEAARKRANLVLSLSPLTFSYQVARVVLIEQLYRVFSIINGLPYHKA